MLFYSKVRPAYWGHKLIRFVGKTPVKDKQTSTTDFLEASILVFPLVQMERGQVGRDVVPTSEILLPGPVECNISQFKLNSMKNCRVRVTPKGTSTKLPVVK